MVHQISEPILVNDDMAATPPLLQLSNGDVAAPVEYDRANVSLFHPVDINEDEYINKNQPPRAKKIKAKTNSDGDSLYNVDENIEELSNFDEELLHIPSGPVDIAAAFEDIYKNKGFRYEGKLGGDDTYFDSSDPGSEISDEEEGDPVNDDEVVDPLPRTSSSKIYFDKNAKKKKDFSSRCGSQPSMQASTSTATTAGERDANASTAEEMLINAKSSNKRPSGRPSNA
ncbi:hypothetical protein CQW23_23870 [Capsicum baccatum]|uniref:Uncharacterized protein n=1 Tax=Capsicum baccatum TaxID=33114 RepID=A0A2G2VT50_CAPBA|nr:hypothetical protein CQW23_23870 [Capsicum baccatum]